MTRPVQQSLIDPTLERPVGPLPMSVVQGTNADLIAKVAPLYLTGSVLDTTYGKGKWWDRFVPEPFTFHDLELDGVDFRSLPYGDGAFDAVCYDPPYVISGTHSSKRLGPDFQDRYGIGQHNFPHPVGDQGRGELWELILGGFAECCRVAKCYVLVKCMEFAQGGKFHDVPTMVKNAASEQGLTTWDVIVHNTGSGPGGHNIWEPLRARRAHSYLLVFRKPGAARTERSMQ